MKVLFVHEGYIAEHNGEYSSVSYNNDIVKRYKTLAEEVVFLTRKIKFEESQKKFNKITIEGFKFVGVENFKSLRGITKIRTIKEKVKAEVLTSDFIIARLPSDLGNIAIKYARKYKKRYLIELVGCPWDALWNYSLSGKILAPLLYCSTKKIVKNSPYVIYVSSSFLQSRYPTNGLSTNCSNVSLPEIDYQLMNITQKIKKRDLSSPIILGTAAVVDVKYKGQENVIKVVSDLVKRGLNIEYQLLGNGDQTYLKSIAKKFDIEDNIKFIGSVPHEKVFEWLNTIDIYIQPSVTEGLPRALIEAMSNACVCIGSDAGGIPELLPKKNIFKKGNSDSLEKVLLNAIENGHKTVEETFFESMNYSKKTIEKRRESFLLSFANENITDKE